MAFVCILFAELILAAYILSMVFLIAVYLIKNISIEETTHQAELKEIFENPLAIVFFDTANETDILSRVQELQLQQYKNYSAYFFVKQAIVLSNHLPQIKIISLQPNDETGLNLLEQAKSHFLVEPKAIIALHCQTSLSKDYLSNMNLNILKGKLAVQSQVIVDGNNESLINYQKIARIFLDSIDREVPSSVGISASIWGQGFMLDKSIYDEVDFNMVGANDKSLQAQIILNSVKIDYDSNARVFAKTLDTKALNAKKKFELRMYLYNLGLGINLLFAGLKKPNLDKIVFGLNYLRPPVYLVMLASILLFGLNQISQISFNAFYFISTLGLLVGVLLTKYGESLLNFIKTRLYRVRFKNTIGSNHHPKNSYKYTN
jgi:hypothetical protein